jgi:chromosome segregation protein
MDKGAHFYKCDFQVHTPRDLGWKGGDAVTDTERKTYAEELILACRQKGLDAIAITDHHDFAFFPYIRTAAQEELDDVGNPIAAEKRLIVFPGIELTLTSPACQALLLLDADFPLNLLQSVLTALAITPSAATDSRHAEIQRIPQNVVGDLGHLYATLNSHEHLKGRFIVLPNVSETGHGTLLRTGFANFYKSMPCVGGYTDGPVTQFGTGNLGIVSGQNREYGFKAIAVFQTSDNRKRDHVSLGTHTTWVKWSEPTAEALRQACLAKESRLSQVQPDLPSRWITSLSVSNSLFMKRTDVALNQQYNAVIGGRGTGKSTILEYLRWGLCDQAIDDSDSDIAPVQMRRKKLIADTLHRVDGEVVVSVLLDDVPIIIKRRSKTQEIFLRIGDEDFVEATEDEVRSIFPVQAYSQKQLSSVGVRIEELKRFVELPIKQRLDKVRSAMRDTEAKIRVAYGNVVRKREIEAEIATSSLELTSLSQQLGTLKEGLKGLSEADQETIGLKTLYDNEEHIIENLATSLSLAKDQVTTLSSEIRTEEDEEIKALEIHNTVLIGAIRAHYSSMLTEVREQMDRLVGLFEGEALQEIEAERKKWQAAKEAFEKKYEGAKAKATVNQQQLRRIREVETRIAEVRRLAASRRAALTALGRPEDAYKELKEEWDRLQTEKMRILADECEKFSALSGGLIKADLSGSLDVESLKVAFKAAFAGMNVKEQKIDSLCQQVLAAPDAIAAWNGILTELEGLALHDSKGPAPIPATPVLDRCGVIESEKARLAASFDPGRWLELAVTKLEINPRFVYCTNRTTSEYIGFPDASAGQQATALLTVLLNQEGGPLIIDQPEDDVASKMSPEIVEQIWKAKQRRQLIFASHNANFVVNGDAELVICCDYVTAGDQTAGQIKNLGAIDNGAIREEITLVTEGGKEAFKLRKEKYGF